MAYVPSDGSQDMLAAFKIVVAGGFGAGKTTLVGAVSEVRPLRTEEALTSASIGLDDLSGVGNKTTTTVAMDFGRITLSSKLVLYLFGTPGQERFWFMWDELSYGALGAVVLADTRRLDDCFPSVDYFENCGLPFVVAINCFDDSPQYDPEDVRVALDLDPRIPVMLVDARQVSSVKEVLITLVEYVLASRPVPLHERAAMPPTPTLAAQPTAPQSVTPQAVTPQAAGTVLLPSHAIATPLAGHPVPAAAPDRAAAPGPFGDHPDPDEPSEPAGTGLRLIPYPPAAEEEATQSRSHRWNQRPLRDPGETPQPAR